MFIHASLILTPLARYSLLRQRVSVLLSLFTVTCKRRGPVSNRFSTVEKAHAFHSFSLSFFLCMCTRLDFVQRVKSAPGCTNVRGRFERHRRSNHWHFVRYIAVLNRAEIISPRRTGILRKRGKQITANHGRASTFRGRATILSKRGRAARISLPIELLRGDIRRPARRKF